MICCLLQHRTASTFTSSHEAPLLTAQLAAPFRTGLLTAAHYATLQGPCHPAHDVSRALAMHDCRAAMTVPISTAQPPRGPHKARMLSGQLSLPSHMAVCPGMKLIMSAPSRHRRGSCSSAHQHCTAPERASKASMLTGSG